MTICGWAGAAANAARERRSGGGGERAADGARRVAVQRVIAKQAPETECALHLRARLGHRGDVARQFAGGRHVLISG
jgi:hypothetical protein